MDTQLQIENFLASHEYAEETKITYRAILYELVNQPFETWQASDLLKFIQRENWGNSRQYMNLCACRSFIAWLHGQSHPALIARIKRIKSKKQRSMNMNQVIQLLALFDTYTPQGARDQAIAALAIDTGLRAAELAAIQLANVDREHNTLQVIVKGGQWGVAIYSAETAAIIERWLQYRKPADGTNALFISMNKNIYYGRPLTKHGIKMLFRKWSVLLGWKVSPHDARRTFGNLTTIMGAPQKVAMAAGRWESEEAFRRYTEDVTAQAIKPYLPITNALKPNHRNKYTSEQ